MIVDTHLLISQILYKGLSNQMDFKINRLAFAYGNIKPDFNNKDINRPHTMYQSLYCVNKFSKELMNRDISINEFSKFLGVICHFSSDYFGIYHREGNDKKGVFEHLFYEFILHVKLLILLLSSKIKSNNSEILEDSIEAIVLNLEKKYNRELKGLSRDITYALFAAFEISKLIVCSSQLYSNEKGINILKQHQVSGGSI